MILVFDTSGAELSIGLASKEGALMREVHISPDGATERAIHDARLALETANMMESESIVPQEIERIGIVIGPGSFTGLRIGLSFAKGLAFAIDAGIVPLTLHEIMRAERASFEGMIVTPGYKPDLFYVSESNRPNEINRLNGKELLQRSPASMLAHDYFLTHSSPFIPHASSFISPSLSTMAELCMKSNGLRGTEIDALEPLYLTEFNAKIAERR